MRITLSVALACALAAASASAHHPTVELGTVRITQPVVAGGTVLQPGTYEIRDTGEHVTPLPGQSAEAQTHVEFVQNGKVVARDVAEVMTAAPGAVGTSGAANTRLRFERLRGDEFMRISAYHSGERLLIHLPTKR